MVSGHPNFDGPHIEQSNGAIIDYSAITDYFKRKSSEMGHHKALMSTSRKMLAATYGAEEADSSLPEPSDGFTRVQMAALRHDGQELRTISHFYLRYHLSKLRRDIQGPCPKCHSVDSAAQHIELS
jgi:hypothetical protein